MRCMLLPQHACLHGALRFEEAAHPLVCRWLTKTYLSSDDKSLGEEGNGCSPFLIVGLGAEACFGLTVIVRYDVDEPTPVDL